TIMETFQSLLDHIEGMCEWGCIPRGKVSELARISGRNEAATLIQVMDRLRDAELEDDPGDINDYQCCLREACEQALVEIGERALGPLLDALRSANPHTRGRAAMALGRIGAKQAFGPIVALLGGEENDIFQIYLIRAIGDLRDVRGIEVLLPYLRVTGGV